MSFLKPQIETALNENPLGLIKEACTSLDAYFQYYSILRFENIKDILTSINDYSFFTIRGVSGAGKSSFKTVLKNTFEDNIAIFEHNCNEITELDDIFFNLYKFILKNPIKKDIRNQKSNFKPSSIDEQILYYLKKNSGNLVLIFDNFEKLLNTNAELKAENIKSFFQFLSTLPNIKVILLSATMLTNALEIPQEQIKTTQLLGLNEEQVKDFLAIFKVEVIPSLLGEICETTRGAIYSLKFLANSHKILNLPISALLKERAQKGKDIEEFLAQKLIMKLPPSARKVLFYLTMFRHELDINILKSIDKFENIQEDIALLQNYMLIEGKNNIELRNFVKNMIFSSLSDRNKMHFHNKIANFYAEQIPLKPSERVIKISRSSMYSEKFHHYNVYSKLSKNFELQSAIVSEPSKTSDNKLDSQKIKYIASTKYFPDFEIKKEDKKSENNTQQLLPKEKKVTEIEITSDITLTDEEKKLLEENDIAYETNTYREEIPTPTPEPTSFREDLDEKIEEIKQEETELEKAEKLLKKGQKLFDDGLADQSITYLKNAMSLLQDNDANMYYQAKLTLAKALLDNFKYEQASEYFKEIIHSDASIPLIVEAYIELAQIDEYENKIENAINKFNNAVELAASINDKESIAKVYFRMGLLYDDANDTEKALYHYLLAATEAVDKQDKAILASIYANIASIYDEQGDLEKAIEYYNKSLKVDEYTQNYFGQAKNLSALGNIFFSSKKTNIAIKFFIKATQVAKQANDIYLLASSYLELGDTFLNIQDYKNALKAYFLAKKNIDNTISTDSKNKVERRFDMIVDEIGEKAYRFLVKELKQR